VHSRREPDRAAFETKYMAASPEVQISFFVINDTNDLNIPKDFSLNSYIRVNLKDNIHYSIGLAVSQTGSSGKLERHSLLNMRQCRHQSRHEGGHERTNEGGHFRYADECAADSVSTRAPLPPTSTLRSIESTRVSTRVYARIKRRERGLLGTRWALSVTAAVAGLSIIAGAVLLLHYFLLQLSVLLRSGATLRPTP